ncbi:MAG: NADP-dependent oxidoreductase, partial [Phenylobacterium sp.]|nr:NADP-dependent oxidoreductase [Phenylobacterium sp.]
MPKSREIHLVRRPTGPPTPDDFALVERDVADAADGEVLVENLLMSVDPAMRPRLTSGQALDEAMMGGALGRVVQSKTDAFAVGDLITSRLGFREYFTSDG